MAKKEKKIKKSKNIEQEVATETSVETVDDFAAQIEQELEKQEQEAKYIEKIIVQDGKTFIDITENYISKPAESPHQEPAETQVVHQKKKVRTFHFSLRFSFILSLAEKKKEISSFSSSLSSFLLKRKKGRGEEKKILSSF